MSANKHEASPQSPARHPTEPNLLLFRQLLDQSRDAVFIVDAASSRILDVNETACQCLQFTREELLRRSVLDLQTDLPDLAAWTAHIQEVRAQGQLLKEYEGRRRDGSVFPIEVSIRYVTVAEQAFLVTILRDITARKQSEAALRESEAKYRALVETTDTGCLILDQQGRVVDANAEYVRLSGHRELREIIGHSVLEWTVPQEQQQNAEAVAQCVRNRGIRNLAINYLWPDGRIVPVEINATVQGEGEAQRIISLCRDLSGRKEAEQKIKDYEKQFSALFHGTHDGILLADPLNRTFSLANEAIGQMLGYSLEELTSMGVADIHPLADLPYVVEQFEKQIRGEITVARDIPLLRKDGAILYADVSGTMITVGGKNYLAGFFRDVTARRQAEEALKVGEAEQRAILNAVQAGIVIVDPETHVIVKVNPRAAELIGEPVEQLVGSICHKHICPVEQGRCPVTDLGQVVDSSERVLLTADGAKLPIIETVVPIILGGHKHLLESFVDISSLKQAEEARRASDERYRLLADHADDFVLLNHVDGRRLYVSPSFYRVTGWTLEDLQSTAWRTRIHPDDLPLVEKAHAANLAGETTQIEYRMRCKNDSWLWVDTRCKPITDAEGRVQQMLLWSRDITARKQAEAALQASEETLRLTTVSARDAIIMLDNEGKVTFWNNAAEQMFGYTRAEVLGRDLHSWHVPERYRQAFQKGFQHFQRTGQGAAIGKTLELTALRKDGVEIPVELSLSATELKGQWHSLGIMRDITERKRTEEKLRESEARHRALVEALPDMLFRINRNGVIYDYKAESESALYVPPEIFLGKPFAEVMPHPLAASCRAAIERATASGKVQAFEYKLPLAQGEHDFEARVVVDQQGDATFIVRDITERKRTAEAHKRLATAVEQAAEAIVITDADATILYVNPAFESITGYTRQEAVGQNPRLLKSGRMNAAFYKQLWRTLTSGEVWHGHFSNKRKDGTLYDEEATISPIRDVAGRITNYVAIKLDATHAVQLEAQLRQAQKMEAVGRLAGGVAHDFNNILQVILGDCELLQTATASADPRRAQMQEIHESAQRAASLTRQLLAFSRRQMLTFKVVNLNDLILGMQKMLRRIIGEDIQVVTEMAAMHPLVMADAGQLEQVILNLAVNARDAMPSGGRLIINTAIVAYDKPDIHHLPNAQPGTFARLAITDTGTGMSSETVAHIFEPFFSTKGLGKGTGLGLSVIFGIVQQHNGWINVYSQEGCGTTFKIYLPLAPAQPDEPGAARLEDALPAQGHGERILVIEDEPAVRNLALHVLSAAGYQVFAVDCATKGLALFEKEQARFDLLFSDVVLPDETGITLAEELRRQKPGLPVLLCSGYTDERSRWADIQKYGFHFLQKPYPSADLLRTVRRILDTRPAPPP